MVRGCSHRVVHCCRAVSRKTQSQRLVWWVVGSLLFTSAQAFEESGHIMVAQLTMPMLTEGARVEIKRLYGDDWLREVVSRAAMVQTELNRPKNQYQQPLQVTLFGPDDKGFDAEKHCPKNACSVAAILESRQVLMSSGFSDADKRQALLYLMHYMVQLHIPLNCGLIRDQGGQKIYLKDDALQPVNFSWIWNHDLYRRENKRWFTYAQELYRDMAKLDTQAWTKTLSVADWAFESHTIALQEVYPEAVEGRYSASLIKKGQKLMEQQLMKAAFRTAALLNDMFPEPEEEKSMN
ncbi:MAG: S1/P1 nuclease [Reinekea sp.]|nr:S1/P1 nuclease [Reinekea sp.]